MVASVVSLDSTGLDEHQAFMQAHLPTQLPVFLTPDSWHSEPFAVWILSDVKTYPPVKYPKTTREFCVRGANCYLP